MLAIYTNHVEYVSLNTDFFDFFFFRKRNLLSLHIFIWGKKERKRTKYQSVNSALKLTYTKQEKK